MDDQDTSHVREDDRGDELPEFSRARSGGEGPASARRRPSSRLALAAIALLLLAGCGNAQEDADLAQPAGGVGKIVFSIFEGLPAFNGNEACSGLWAVNPDGSGLMRLTMPDPKEFESQYYPSFSPDGNLLAFEVLNEAGSEGSYQVESEASVLEGKSGDVRSLAMFTSSLFVNPRVIWSPKNDSVLTMRLKGELTEIARVEIEGGDEDVIFDGKSFVASAAWAPDGSRIALWSYRSSGIWLMDPDGGNRGRLVRGGGPAWAPDSRRLAFFDPAEPSEISERNLWLIGADGSGKRLLVKGVLHLHHSVLWSPRGDRLIFLRKARKPVQPYGEADFYLLELEGGRETLRARAALPLAWSQDGKRILFARQLQVGPDTAIGIYIGSADGTDERLVTVTDEEDINIGSYPVWQPAQAPLEPATGAIAPRKEFDFCIRRLDALRMRLSKRFSR